MLKKFIERVICKTEMPVSATEYKWNQLDAELRKKPLCYFLNNTLPNKMNKIRHKIDDGKHWFMYRLLAKHKYHLIDTGLPPSYYEIDIRMMYGMFNMLKEFCEVEMPNHDQCWENAVDSYEAAKENKVVEKKKKLVGKEAAMASFAWQKELVYTENEVWGESASLVGKPTKQAVDMVEIEKLYLWWTEVRPARPNPYDLVSKTNDEEKFSRKRYEKISELVQKNMDEDTEMMIRLIKIRNSLWT